MPPLPLPKTDGERGVTGRWRVQMLRRERHGVAARCRSRVSVFVLFCSVPSWLRGSILLRKRTEQQNPLALNPAPERDVLVAVHGLEIQQLLLKIQGIPILDLLRQGPHRL